MGKLFLPDSLSDLSPPPAGKSGWRDSTPPLAGTVLLDDAPRISNALL